MPEYDNKNTFVLFRNNKKRAGKNDPDFTGRFTDSDGREYFMDAWSKEPKNGGEKFLGGQVKIKQKQPNNRPAAAALIDDDVPF